MVLLLFILSLLGALTIALANSWFATWHAVWQLPMCVLALFLALTLAFLLLLVLSALCVNRKKEYRRPSRYIRFLITGFSQLALFYGGARIHASGLAQLPQQPYLLVCNHICAIDPIIFYSVLPPAPLCFISKKENERLPIVAPLMHAVCCLPIDRENDRAALRTILKAVDYLQSERTSVAVFPEGATSKTCQLQPFRNGVFKIAQKAGVPIAVCTLTGTRTVLQNALRRRSDIYLDIVKVLQPDSFIGLTTAQLGAQVHDLMAHSLTGHSDKRVR